MNKDFSKYQKIIDDFSGQVLNSDFEAQYFSVAKNISKTDRFLLKMELRRLAAPCTRLIDLRGHVDGECKPFEHEGKIHFLDSIAIKVFQDALLRYGSYTFGVYESTINTENNFRVIYQNEKTSTRNVTEEIQKVFEKTQYPAKFYSFGPYHDRSEERMNFATPVLVSIDEKDSFECTSSDLSVNGCKLRINGIKTIGVGQKISLQFKGVEEGFQFGANDSFQYEIKNILTLENMQLVGVQRLYQQENKKDVFTKVFKDFIQNNKRRYKINVDNTIKALQSRGFEQFILPKSNELPIFIQESKSGLTPKYALTCNNNQGVYQYWQDENHYSTLYCLITPERLMRLKRAAVSGKQLLVFSFVHKSAGKHYFYTADDSQLKDDETFMKQFLAFSAAKPSFAITRLSLLDVNPEKAESPLTLSSTISKKDEHFNAPASEEIKLLLDNTPYIVVAYDVTSHESTKSYQTFSYEGIQASKLKSFGHKRLSKPFSVDEVGINYKNQRQELRFKYNTPISVEIQGVKWKGVSHDFSTSGLKIELDKETEFTKGDIVYISFPSLQKITSAFELKALPYEVMRVNRTKTIINLHVFVEKHQHIGRKFFKALIDKNRDKLTPDEYAMSSPGLAKALRNIYSESSRVPSLVIQTSGSRYKIEVVASGEQSGGFMALMRQLSDRDQCYNLYPLLGRGDVMAKITAKLKKMQRSDIAEDEVLYIAIDHSKEMVDKSVTTKFEAELGSEKLKHIFIHKSLKKGDFYCIKLKLSRAAEPDMDHLNPELSYVGSYAIHRGKQIEQDIWSVAGIAQVFDITQEVVFRYQLTRK